MEAAQFMGSLGVVNLDHVALGPLLRPCIQ